MNLEHVTARLRPRHPWEAVDLGVALFQRHFGLLVRTWAITVLPVVAILWALTGGGAFALPLLLFWFKPVFERVPVFVLGRVLFASPPTLGAVAKALPRLWGRHLFVGLFAHRLNPARGILTPVVVLEGVHGKTLRERQRLIAQDHGGKASFVAFAGAHFESFVALLLHGLIWMLVPDDFLPRFDFDDWERMLASVGAYQHVSNAIFVVTYSLNGLLHASCGFALYIDRRAHLEGWDLEVAFRRLAHEIEARRPTRSSATTTVAKALLALVTCAALWCAGSAHAQDAAPTKPEIRAAVDEVLVGDDFGGTAKEREWVWNDEAREKENSTPTGEGRELDPRAFSGLPNGSHARSTTGTSVATIATWTLFVIVLAVVLGLSIRRWRELRRLREPTRSPALDVMGLDLRPESIPDDVPGAALAAFDAGDLELALSLLYRATLSRLVANDGLRLEPGDTEGDCSRRVRAVVDAPRAAAFDALTSARITVAYAHRAIPRETLVALCDAFATHFPMRSAA